jgi:adenosylmethionine---8-amino-7-oxononanoate aminotransferase
MLMYSPVFLKKLRALTEKLEVHLICDEIATGFGRTGEMMACYHAGIVPDMVTVSKGLSGGFLPISAILTTEKIYSAFYGEYSKLNAFFHSHTYSGNPIACAAGCAVFELFEQTDIIEKNKITGKKILSKVERLKDHKNVGEIRSLGMITAIELVKNKNTKESFDWKERIGNQIYRIAEKKGVLLRSLGDVIYFMPPYIINDEEIDFMTETAMESIIEVLK